MLVVIVRTPFIKVRKNFYRMLIIEGACLSWLFKWRGRSINGKGGNSFSFRTIITGTFLLVSCLFVFLILKFKMF